MAGQTLWAQTAGGGHWAKVGPQTRSWGRGPGPRAKPLAAVSGSRGAGQGPSGRAPRGRGAACVGELLARHLQLFSASLHLWLRKRLPRCGETAPEQGRQEGAASSPAPRPRSPVPGCLARAGWQRAPTLAEGPATWPGWGPGGREEGASEAPRPQGAPGGCGAALTASQTRLLGPLRDALNSPQLVPSPARRTGPWAGVGVGAGGSDLSIAPPAGTCSPLSSLQATDPRCAGGLWTPTRCPSPPGSATGDRQNPASPIPALPHPCTQLTPARPPAVPAHQGPRGCWPQHSGGGGLGHF